MTEALRLAPALAVGFILGLIFFGGLWWTVGKALTAKRPGLWFLASSVARTGLTLAGFYLISAGQWQRFLACVVGFILARPVVTRLTGKNPDPNDAQAGETGNAA